MNILENYAYVPDKDEVDDLLKKNLAPVADMMNEDVLTTCFSCMDLTSLGTNDTPESISRFVGKLDVLRKAFPACPMPASLCIYPNFASQVTKEKKYPEVHTTVTAGCFPTAQSFLEVKLLECTMAVEAGADEVDIVLSHSHFAAGDLEGAAEEIRRIRAAVDKAAAPRKVILKVILETGLMKSLEDIATASFLAMEAGADFIKTSTGKVAVNATPAAAWVMCNCIRKYYEKTGRKVGFKPAGGISTALDAVTYYTIVKSVLGKEWLCRDLFRLGVSRLANNLLSAIQKETVNIF